MITSYEQLFEKVRKAERKTLAVAVAETSTILEALEIARQKEITNSILVGDENKIKSAADKANVDLSNFETIHEPDPINATHKAIALILEGKANMLMKGDVSTGKLLKCVLDKETGLRSGALLSHVAIFEVKAYPKLLLMSDGGMIPYPDLAQKVAIINNAAQIAYGLGIELPKVAILAAIETVNPNMPETIDAAELSKMCERGQLKNMLVDGPLAMDLAVSPEAVKKKNIKSDVAGDTDIFIVPNISVGNIMGKSLIYLAEAKTGGLIVGAKVPIVLLSRADTAETKLNSIALSTVVG